MMMIRFKLHGGPGDGQIGTLDLLTVVKAWLGLRANNPRGTAYGQVRIMETVELEPVNGHRRYKAKPGPNDHYWTPVRRGLRLRWEYGGTRFIAGCRCPR